MMGVSHGGRSSPIDEVRLSIAGLLGRFIMGLRPAIGSCRG